MITNTFSSFAKSSAAEAYLFLRRYWSVKRTYGVDFGKLTTRYERLAETFSALIHIACKMVLKRIPIGSHG